MIQIQDIQKSYALADHTLSILNGITLTIESGDYVSIMGPSGSGKSTLLQLLGCLDKADSGTYILDKLNVSEYSDVQLAAIRNQKIGFIFQSFHLIPHYTALQNVMLPLLYLGLDETTRQEKARYLLNEVGLMDRIGHLPNELSGGERQRVAIARALITNPSLILADEPTGNLDSNMGQTIMTLLNDIHSAGKTVVIVTHDESVAAQTQRVIRLKDGKIA